ncbi:MAG: NAD(P)-dependent oxidoreductase [Candidatus Altarchaeum sp.]|nr:NAD(P)-dependent oxidoreductase [Candidatus Altarchaeum sp.]
MIEIALTGVNGLVGSKIVEILKADENFDVHLISEQQMDITNRENVFNILKGLNFDVFLHLAAYTNVDKAEIEKEKAHKINVEGTRNVFEAVNSMNKNFVYISTDFVFDGKKQKTPFFEDSKPNPVSYYGLTKYEGEKIMKGKGTIIRLSYPYRTKFDNKMDFVRNIKSLLEQGKFLSMVADSLIVPTFIDDIAYALKKFFLSKIFDSKIFHLVGSQALSPYECGKIIAKTFGLDESLIKATTYEEYFKGKAKRPWFSDIKSRNNNFYKMGGFEETVFKFKDEFK